MRDNGMMTVKMMMRNGLPGIADPRRSASARSGTMCASGQACATRAMGVEG
jgi:hypothetical protein